MIIRNKANGLIFWTGYSKGKSKIVFMWDTHRSSSKSKCQFIGQFIGVQLNRQNTTTVFIPPILHKTLSVNRYNLQCYIVYIYIKYYILYQPILDLYIYIYIPRVFMMYIYWNYGRYDKMTIIFMLCLIADKWLILLMYSNM